MDMYMDFEMEVKFIVIVLFYLLLETESEYGAYF